MPREKSPPPLVPRLAKVDAESRPKANLIAQSTLTPSAPAPLTKTLAAFTPKEALTRCNVLADHIPAVVEQMKYHKKQARRLSELASWLYDAVDKWIPKPPPEDTSALVSEGLEKLFRLLYRIEERLRDVGSGNLLTRMNEFQYVQHDLTELEDECSDVATIFGIDASLNADIHRFNKAKQEDELALKKIAAELETDSDALADKIGVRGTNIDEESVKSLQMLLFSSEHTPEKVPPEFKSFAESAARTILSRTKQEISRELPWHVEPKDFKREQKVGQGGFSTVYKAFWKPRQIEVAIKVFQEQGENIDALIKEVIIWKDREHPSLLKFLAGCLLHKPKFLVSPYCKNGNALDYLQVHPEADRAQMLLDVSRGMLFLHSANIAHGDLKARNVLISDEARALVADFGLAEFERYDVMPSRAGTPSGTGEKTPRLIGTPHWLAPECFKDGAVNRKFADVWALGMTSFELYENGAIPLALIKDDELSDKLESGERPPKPKAHVPPDYIWRMMELCWSLETIDRPSFSEITMVLGIFQNPDVKTIQEMSKELPEIRAADLTKWPGFLERLVQVLSTTLKLGTTLSKTVLPDLNPVPELSEPEEQSVILALAILKEITSLTRGDRLANEDIYDSGALPALHSILRRKDDIKNPEIMTITCQIASNVMNAFYRINPKTSLSPGDFMDVLVELIDSHAQNVSSHAMSTIRSLLSTYTYRYLMSEKEKLVQKKRVVSAGLVPKLVNICKESKEGNMLRESLEFIAVLGMTPTSLEEQHIKELCPVIIELAASDADLKSRQYALNTIGALVEAQKLQASHVRSSGIMPQLLDLIKGRGQELFDNYGNFSAGAILQGLAQQDDIPTILELSQISDTEPEPLMEGPEPYPPMNDARISTKISACIALANIANKQKNPEERQALADQYQVFTILQPLLSSRNEHLVDECRTTLALFSSSQDFPFVLELLNDNSSATRVMATKMCVSMVEDASEEKKVAAAESGILHALKLILDNPPSPPPKLSRFGEGEEIDSDNILAPESLSLTGGAVSDNADVPPGPYPAEIVPAALTADRPGPDTHPKPSAALADRSLQPDEDLSTANSPSIEESMGRASNIALKRTNIPTAIVITSAPVISELTPADVPPPSEAMTSDTAKQPTADASSPFDPLISGTMKTPRSPRAKGVTFDSAAQVIITDTESHPTKIEMPYDMGTPPPPLDYSDWRAASRLYKLSERLKATPEGLARQEIENEEMIYQQTFYALDQIITDIPKDALDEVGDAYIAAGIHESLIPLIRTIEGTRFDVLPAVEKHLLSAMRILARMSSSTDDVRLTMIRTSDLLQKLRTILDEEPGNIQAKYYACNTLQGLLSDEGEDNEVQYAVLEADFVPVLDKFMKNDRTFKSYGAQVLSELIWIFDNKTPEETVITAISALDNFCTQAPKNIEEIFEKRMYIILAYLQGVLPRVRKLGLSLVLSFAKRSADHRRTLTNTTGIREMVEECAQSEDEEIASLAKDILEKIKGKRGGIAASKLPRSSRPPAIR